MTNEFRAIIAWIAVSLFLAFYSCDEKKVKKLLGYFLISNLFMIGVSAVVYLAFFIIKTTWRMI